MVQEVGYARLADIATSDELLHTGRAIALRVGCLVKDFIVGIVSGVAGTWLGKRLRIE